MAMTSGVFGADIGNQLPDRAGIGLKSCHCAEILSSGPDVGWFEVHPENYMGAGGPPHRWLTAIREQWPLSLHAVGVSLGSAGGLDPAHVARIRALTERYQPAMVSEHLAWSSVDGAYLNDLLPVPLTGGVLDLFVRNVDSLQTALKRRILVENPSLYLRWKQSEIPETEFLAELARRTGCGLLLDVNNVAVSCGNLGEDPRSYLKRFPMQAVEEIHLAGHLIRETDDGVVRLDDHGSPVRDEVWDLYALTLDLLAGRERMAIPTLIEWDNNVPALGTWLAEAAKADAMMADRVKAGTVEAGAVKSGSAGLQSGEAHVTA